MKREQHEEELLTKQIEHAGVACPPDKHKSTSGDHKSDIPLRLLILRAMVALKEKASRTTWIDERVTSKNEQAEHLTILNMSVTENTLAWVYLPRDSNLTPKQAPHAYQPIE